jgi:glyoxylase-like metal-dependent hydrolase (beta-lactamase superfamily II)
MQEVAPGVRLLSGFPAYLFNVYLVEDVLIDAGTRWARWRISRQLQAHRPALVALTHCHPDHQGSADYVCRRFRVPLACPELDVPAMEGRTRMQPENRVLRLGEWAWSGPRRQVERVLRDGDEVAGFRVVHAPGHTAGHCLFFRESDRVLIAGDVLANVHFITRESGLRQPPMRLSVDPAENRRSILRLAELEPAVVCFGHGPPLYDVTELRRYAEALRERMMSVPQ